MLGSGSQGFGKVESLAVWSGNRQKRSPLMSSKTPFLSFCWPNGLERGLLFIAV